MIGIYTLLILNIIFTFLLCLIILGLYNNYREDQKNITNMILNNFSNIQKQQAKYKKFLKMNAELLEVIKECILNIRSVLKTDEKDINMSDFNSSNEVAEYILNEIYKDPNKNINNISILNQHISLFLLSQCDSVYIYKFVEKGLDLNILVPVIINEKGKKELIPPLRFLIDFGRLDVIKELHKNNKINIDINIYDNITAYEYSIETHKKEIAEYIEQYFVPNTTLINKKRLN